MGSFKPTKDTQTLSQKTNKKCQGDQWYSVCQAWGPKFDPQDPYTENRQNLKI